MNDVCVPAELVEELREAFVQREDVSASTRNANVWNAAVHLVASLPAPAATPSEPQSDEAMYWQARAESSESILTNMGALADDWRDFFQRGDYSDFLTYGAASDALMSLLAGQTYKDESPTASPRPSISDEAEAAITPDLLAHCRKVLAAAWDENEAVLSAYALNDLICEIDRLRDRLDRATKENNHE